MAWPFLASGTIRAKRHAHPANCFHSLARDRRRDCRPSIEISVSSNDEEDKPNTNETCEKCLPRSLLSISAGRSLYRTVGRSSTNDLYTQFWRVLARSYGAWWGGPDVMKVMCVVFGICRKPISSQSRGNNLSLKTLPVCLVNHHADVQGYTSYQRIRQ